MIAIDAKWWWLILNDINDAEWYWIILSDTKWH